MSIGSWGERITFECSSDGPVRTFRALRRGGGARWHDHDVYAKKPKSDFIGPGLDSLTLDIRLDYARGVNPTEELQALRDARDAGAVETLVVGDEVLFDCRIDSINEERIRHDGSGKLLVALVEITFKEYVA